jgi:hypothetical protein
VVAAALAALQYWSARLACPLDPLIDVQHSRQNIGAELVGDAASGQDLHLHRDLWLLLRNLRFDIYINKAAPQVWPMSHWLVPGRVSWDEVHGWRGG